MGSRSAANPSYRPARIRNVLGGPDARERSKSIARTETTSALNSGHYHAIQDIEASDMVVGKEWLAIGDDSTCETHLNAHGQIAPKGQSFVVGGFECRYPGDVLLPAAERIRCRCTTIAAFKE